VASIYVFDDGAIEAWGNATYISGTSTYTFSESVANPCYTTSAVYKIGDPTCLVGALPDYTTGWMYGQTTTIPVLPTDVNGVPYAPATFVYESPALLNYHTFDTTFGGQPPPTDMVLALRYDANAAGPQTSYLTNGNIPPRTTVPEPGSMLLPLIGFAVVGLARRWTRT
jgi:hypothetical protein